VSKPKGGESSRGSGSRALPRGGGSRGAVSRDALSLDGGSSDALSRDGGLGDAVSRDEHLVKALAETFLRFAESAETQQRQLATLAKVPATVVRIPLFETPLADVDGLGAVVQAIW
jgi:hypothetical protein